MKKLVMLLFLLCFTFTSFASVMVVKEIKEKHKTEQTFLKVLDFQKAVITPSPSVDVGILQKQIGSKVALFEDRSEPEKTILTTKYNYTIHRNWRCNQSSPDKIPKGFN
jgi:queuine/archaeosine tRNA-ribosyltransferase